MGEVSNSSHSMTKFANKADAIRAKLSDVPLGELLEFKEKVGTAMCSKILYGASSSSSTAESSGGGGADNDVKTYKRDNVKRPREMSAKNKVSVFREVFVNKKSAKRDPRFDDKCGEFKLDRFQQNYKFINEMKDEEISTLKKRLRRETDLEKRNEIKTLLRRIANKEKSEKLQTIKLSKKKEVLKQNRQRMKEGKEPFYVKKSELNRSAKDDYLNELEKKGKLEKYLKRKSKKEARQKPLPFFSDD